MAPSTKESEKKPEEKKDQVEEKKEEVVVEKPVELSIEDEILANIVLIGRAVTAIEPRFTIRVLRTLTGVRRKLNKEVLRTVLEKAYPSGSKTGQALIASSIFQELPEAPAKEEAMEVDPTPENVAASSADQTVESAEKEKKDEKKVEKKAGPPKYVVPVDAVTGDLVLEGTIYLRLLLLLATLDAQHVKQAAAFADETVEIVSNANRRTMDPLAAKVYFYLARAYEIEGRLGELQSLLLATRQTAALRKDETLEVTVINLLLRSYLSQNQYDQADRLIAKTSFQGQVNQAQSVRWLFYAGRLRAIQLNYSKAKDYFQTAIRRAPKDETAPGFVQAIHKYFIVVTLLTGQIPDRAMFRKPILQNALAPYFQIVQAVRTGDVTAFQKTFSAHESTFVADSTAFLILRLRQVVIKTALRTITLAYSRISLADVCVKLHLDSEEDTEYIVAKAIKDGVVDATIDREEGTMISRMAKNVYETDEPAKAFGRRTEHCSGVYVETVRAMRYPPNAHRKELDSAADARERDREIAQMIQEEADDVDDEEM